MKKIDMQKVLVWDWPVRIGHWLMVAGFVVAWLTSESDDLRLIHAIAGSTVLATAAFRVIWGVIGSRTARFSNFVRGPRAVRDYLLGLYRLQPTHFTGHNPAGGWAIVLLLVTGMFSGACGWALYNELGGHWLEELHEGMATAMLLLALVHLAGVLVGSLLHGENLVRSMMNGFKAGRADDALSTSHRLIAVLMLLCISYAVWWLVR